MFQLTRGQLLLPLAAALLALGAHTGPATAADTVLVGGEQMFPDKTIVANAVNSKAHTTLVAAVKVAGLAETLSGAGPFTVFAPTNDAFENLPEGTVETLLKEENKDKLTAVLTYHVIPSRVDSTTLKTAMAKRGAVRYKTANGGLLTFKPNGNNVIVEDANGNTANISVVDVFQSNGVIHVIDAVLLPK